MHKMKITAFGAALVMSLAANQAAQAAFIIFDDSDPNTITITAGDFENGFSIDGVLVTSGLGNSTSITLPDGGYGISGSWIDLGLSDGAQRILYFALTGGDNNVTSGVEFSARTDGGGNGTLQGSFGGFTGATYFLSLPTQAQGTTGNTSAPFLSVTFISEPIGVAEPATMALLGAGLLGVAAIRRKRA